MQFVQVDGLCHQRLISRCWGHFVSSDVEYYAHLLKHVATEWLTDGVWRILQVARRHVFWWSYMNRTSSESSQVIGLLKDIMKRHCNIQKGSAKSCAFIENAKHSYRGVARDRKYKRSVQLVRNKERSQSHSV